MIAGYEMFTAFAWPFLLGVVVTWVMEAWTQPKKP